MFSSILQAFFRLLWLMITLMSQVIVEFYSYLDMNEVVNCLRSELHTNWTIPENEAILHAEWRFIWNDLML